MKFVAALTMSLALSFGAACAADLPVPSPRAVTETIMTTASGHQHRIVISVPTAPAPKSGYPVLYVLDGEGWMGAAVEIAKMREYEKLPPTIVVGVGYPGKSFFDAEGRSYDFTLPGSSDPDFEGIALGGADDFLAFLTGTLRPYIAAHYATDPGKQILFGHSLGGSFALYALFKAPESFNVFLAASPAIPLFNRNVLRDESAFEANPARTIPRILITVGSLEARPSPGLVGDYRRYYIDHPEAHPEQTVDQAIAELFDDKDPRYDKIADTKALVDRLTKSGVKATFVEFADEEHMSSAISALNRGIPFALRPAN